MTNRGVLKLFEVEVPDSSEQFRKTPAKRLVTEEIEVERIEPVGVGDGRERVFYIPEGQVTRVLVDGEETKEVEIEPGKITFRDAPRGRITAFLRRKERIKRWIRYIRSREKDGEIETEVIRWGDWLDEFRKKLRYRPLSECVELVKELLDETPKVETKADLVKFLLSRLFGQKPKAAKLIDHVAELEKRFVELGRWGLGCPNNCGRFWWFKPHKEYGWVPVDDKAWQGEIEWLPTGAEYDYDRGIWLLNGEEVKPEKRIGYLDWRIDEDGCPVFKCDRCGAIIKLKRGGKVG